jgi:hypothetical protein
MDFLARGDLLKGVVARDPVRALQARNPSDIRRRQALFHPDKGGDVKLSQLANACADVLNGRGRLSDAHVAIAQPLLKEWQRELDELRDREWLEHRRIERAEAVAALLPQVKLIVDGLERVKGREASKAADVKNLLRKRLALTRIEAGRLLTQLGVKRCAKAGRAVLSLNSKCLRVPADRCCACGRPPLDDVFQVFEHAAPDDASTLTEVQAFVRRVRDVSLSEARRLTQEAGVVSKQCRRRFLVKGRDVLGTRAAFRDGNYIRVPPNACVVCGRAPPPASERT